MGNWRRERVSIPHDLSVSCFQDKRICQFCHLSINWTIKLDSHQVSEVLQTSAYATLPLMDSKSIFVFIIIFMATPVGIEPAFSHRKWLVLTIIRWGHFILAFLFWKINQKMPRRRPVCHLYKGDVGQYVHWHCHHQKPSTWQKGIWLTRVVFAKHDFYL